VQEPTAHQPGEELSRNQLQPFLQRMAVNR
jgi:hypothetical protein